MNDALIVSVGDRGSYLAHQLQKNGVSTTVLDLSNFVPSVLSSQREGPFGVFVPSELNDLQKQYLYGDNSYPLSTGFSTFTPSGPIEFQGPLSSFFLKTRKDFRICYSALSFLLRKNNPNFVIDNQKHKFLELKQSSWLLRLSAELTSSYQSVVYKKNNPQLWSPFFSDYIFRESSQKYLANQKSILESEGVQYLETSKKNNLLKDLKITKKGIKLQIHNQEKNYSYLVWTLSGPETQQSFPEFMPVLFPKWTEPIYIWQKFSLAWNQEEFNHIIPSLLLVLPDETHKNSLKTVLSLKKHPSAYRADLWILCSYQKRFNEAAMKIYLQSAMEKLKKLFSGFSLQGFMPEDLNSCSHYFVVYKQNNILQKKLFFQGFQSSVFYLNPESATKLDAYSLMQESEKIFQNILNLHSGRDLKNHVK